VLVAASLLSIPSRRIRALAHGDQSGLRDWLANESARRLAEARSDARRVMRVVESAGACIVACCDEAYPLGLLDLPDPPPFLVVEGSLARGLTGGDGTAIVGTREPTPEAAAYAFELAARVDGPVVSGLALGIDGAAHRGALAAGTLTIAYVAHGLGATYPPEHVELAREIVAAGGSIASERLPGERVTRFGLARRDRLQAAHARCVVLVESESGGGAMQTMRVARRLGRASFVRVRDAADDARGALPDGNRDALADGAEPLEDDPTAATNRLRFRRSGAAERSAPRHGALLSPWKGPAVSATFEPFDLDRAKSLVGDELDALPFGVIVVDRKGTILEYNAYESEFAGFARARVLGRNFFHDVAPCTAIQEFEGRFVSWLESSETSIEPFEFEFPFTRGAQRVSVVFVRTSFAADHATICVARRPNTTKADGTLDL